MWVSIFDLFICLFILNATVCLYDGKTQTSFSCSWFVFLLSSLFCLTPFSQPRILYLSLLLVMFIFLSLSLSMNSRALASRTVSWVRMIITWAVFCLEPVQVRAEGETAGGASLLCFFFLLLHLLTTLLHPHQGLWLRVTQMFQEWISGVCSGWGEDVWGIRDLVELGRGYLGELMRLLSWGERMMGEFGVRLLCWGEYFFGEFGKCWENWDGWVGESILVVNLVCFCGWEEDAEMGMGELGCLVKEDVWRIGLFWGGILS